MLGLDLERELAFLDKPTQGLVLVVRYVCAFVIKRTPSRALLWVLTFTEAVLAWELRCLRCKSQVVCCKLEHRQV